MIFILSTVQHNTYASSQCLNSLTELFSNDYIQKEKVQKFLGMQATLTRHKLSYAMFRNDVNSERFELEKEILKAANELEKSGKKDPEFLAVKKSFEENSLSRHHLAAILPFVKNIVNDQLKENDVLKRELFHLNSNDLKILSIIAEAEITDDYGIYDSRLSTNLHSRKSLVNLTRTINNDIETPKRLEERKAFLRKEIDDIEAEIKRLIDGMNLPVDCTNIVYSCQQDGTQTELIDREFLGLILSATDKASGVYHYKYLKNTKKWQSEKKNYKVSDIKRVHKNTVQPLDYSAKEKVEAYLIAHVLDHFSYFVDQKTLREDPELLSALAQAIDRGAVVSKDVKERYFDYSGKRYQIPEMWNKIYPKNEMTSDQYYRGASSDRHEIMRRAITKFKSEDLPKNIIERGQKDDFLRVLAEQLVQHKHKVSFEYKGRLYDLKTGQLIPGKVEGILGYPIPADQKIRVFEKDSEQVLAQKALAIEKREKTFFDKKELKYISGHPVDENKVYLAALNEQKKQGALKKLPSKEKMQELNKKTDDFKSFVIKAIADNKRAFVFQNKAYDLLKVEPFKPIKKTYQGTPFHAVDIDHSPTGFVSNIYHEDSVELKVAELNKEDDYFDSKNNRISINGRKIASVGESRTKEASYYHEDQINGQGDLAVLQRHFQINKNNKCKFHTVVNKKENSLNVFNQSGEIVFQKEALLGRVGDQLGTAYTTAGIRNSGEAKDPLSIRAMRDEDVEEKITYNNNDFLDNRENRNGDSSIVILPEDYDTYKNKYQDPSCPYYVISDSDELRFMLNDNKLEFKINSTNAFNMNCNLPSDKLCPKDLKLTESDSYRYQVLKLSFNNEALVYDNGYPDNYGNIATKNIKKFISSLESNKKELMKELKLSNKEYDQLARMAVGVMGVESSFGSGDRYKDKEKNWGKAGQLAVSIGKYFKGNKSANSRGLTQIKEIESYVKNSKSFKDLKGEDLNSPDKAAIGTMFVLAQKLKDLEIYKSQHPGLNEVNKLDYLYTLYSGSAHRIGTRDATPKLSKKHRELIRYTNSIEIMNP